MKAESVGRHLSGRSRSEKTRLQFDRCSSSPLPIAASTGGCGCSRHASIEQRDQYPPCSVPEGFKCQERTSSRKRA